MSLRPYLVSANHRKIISRTGFDIDDPDRRHPVQNPELKAILAQKRTTNLSRATLLKRARWPWQNAPSRTLALLGATVAATLGTTEAEAVPYTYYEEHWWAAFVTETTLISLPDWVIWLSAYMAILLLVIFIRQEFIASRQKRGSNMKKRHKRRSRNSAARDTKLKQNPAPAEQRPSKYIWRVSGASRMGKVRTENQDAFSLWQVAKDEAYLVVCDGAGGIEGGKAAADSAAQTIIQALKAKPCVPHRELFRLTDALEQARNVSKARGLTGITTAIVAYIKGADLHYATLGDGALVTIWPDGMNNQIQTPHHVLGQPSNIIGAFIGHDCQIPPRTGTTRLEVGTTLFLMSDGASDLFPYEDYAHHRDLYAERIADAGEANVADQVLIQLETARDIKTGAYLHSDNMTLIMAHLDTDEVDRFPLMANLPKEEAHV